MEKRTKIIWIVVAVLFVSIGGWLVIHAQFFDISVSSQDNPEQEQEEEIAALLDARRSKQLGESDDGVLKELFADSDTVSVLLIGLDTRAGKGNAHCDAIQLIEIDKKRKRVDITAVPRGTYAPLPGSGHLPSDYYVSNSCAIGGIDYGINQIEKILGKQSDFVVFVGFSEALGIFRTLQLPTTETLQWLRQRQGYAIGEPQRARNHSTFIKQLITRFVPEQRSRLDVAWQYILYSMVQTDLSFAQARELVQVLSDMDIANHPEYIHLAMRPAYAVQDIPYDPDNIDEHLARRLQPIAQYLPKADYSGESEDVTQEKLLTLIEEGIEDPAFIQWAYEHKLWLQIENDATRESWHFQLLELYVPLLNNPEKQEEIIADYILEMEHKQLDDFVYKGKKLLQKILSTKQ